MKLFPLLVALSLSVSVLCLGAEVLHELQPSVSFDIVIPVESIKKEASLFFVGDLMLGRNVEVLMHTYGIEYPFQNVFAEVSSSDVTIGNFEGVVTKEHVRAPAMSFQFSIEEAYLKYLSSIGFDILSFANNHALDYGKSELHYARSVCTAASLRCGGTPNNIDTFSTIIQEVEGIQIGFIFLHTLYGEPNPILLQTALDDLRAKSDVQIAYVHWGVEYELLHNSAQENLAHVLIDGGIDAVVGHHPHVVQDISLYKEKPIFYSLGNFIFDQYFSNDVQEELGVRMTIFDNAIRYELVPFTSLEKRSQPKRMTSDVTDILYARIFKQIQNDPLVDALEGVITTPR